MRAFGVFVFICALLGMAIASTVFTKDYSDSKHPGKCVFDEKVYEPGKHKLADLVWFECEANGMGTYIASAPLPPHD